MKADEVVTLLQTNLPKFSDLFSDNLSVVSLSSSGTTVTANVVGHGLVVGNNFIMTGAEANVPIDTLTRNGIVGTLVTLTDHDLTNGLGDIEIALANESEFNGIFKLINIDSRREIRFVMEDSGPTVATGSPVLVKAESAFRGFNGLQTVASVLDVDNLTYETVGADMLSPTGTIVLKKGLRISAGGSVARLVAAYTKQPPSTAWIYAVLGNVRASKSRHIDSDATDNLQRNAQGKDFRQQIVNELSIYVFLPTATQLTSREARDTCEELFAQICGSILFHDFDTGLAKSDGSGLSFVSHNFQAYNAAFYVHEYNFQQVSDLSFGDTVGEDVDVAFRDISLKQNLDFGTQEDSIDSEINLDDKEI